MEDFIEGLKEEESSAMEDHLDQRERLMNHFKAGTAWFFWIAGISLFISLIPLVGWHFLTSIFELGFSQYIEYEAAGIVRQLQPDSANIVKGAATLLALEVTGLFVLFGVLSRKGYQWAMITGIIIYILDGYFVFRAGSFGCMLTETLNPGTEKKFSG